MSKKISVCDDIVDYGNLELISENEIVYIPGIIKDSNSGIWTNVKIDWKIFRDIFALAAKLTEVKDSLDEKIAKCENDIIDLDKELKKVLDFGSLESGKVVITHRESGTITTSDYITIDNLNCLENLTDNVQEKLNKINSDINVRVGFPDYSNRQLIVEYEDEKKYPDDPVDEFKIVQDGWLYIYCSKGDAIDKSHALFLGSLKDQNGKEVMEIASGGWSTEAHDSTSVFIPIQKDYKLVRRHAGYCKCYLYPSLT